MDVALGLEVEQSFWRIEEGGLPGCPVGTAVSLVQEGSWARVLREGIGQVGTLQASTTEQTSTPDGSSITLVNQTEGWRAILSRQAGYGGTFDVAPIVDDHQSLNVAALPDPAFPETSAGEITREYKSTSEDDARSAFAADKASLADSYDVVTSTWQPGKRRTVDWIAAVILCLVSFGLGVIPVLLWLIFGHPIGTLTVVLRPTASTAG